MTRPNISSILTFSIILFCHIICNTRYRFIINMICSICRYNTRWSLIVKCCTFITSPISCRGNLLARKKSLYENSGYFIAQSDKDLQFVFSKATSCINHILEYLCFSHNVTTNTFTFTKDRACIFIFYSDFGDPVSWSIVTDSTR